MNDLLNSLIIEYESKYGYKLTEDDIDWLVNTIGTIKGSLDDTLGNSKESNPYAYPDDSFINKKLDSIKGTGSTLKVYVEEFKNPLILTFKGDTVELKTPIISHFYAKEKLSPGEAIEKINEFTLHKIEVKEATKDKDIGLEISR